MDDLLALFTQAGKLFREAVDEAMNRHGVRVGQHIVLSALWDTDGLAPGEIARRLGVSTPTIVNTATRMEQAGLLTRRPDPGDARLVRLYLTPRGRSAREPVREARAVLEQQATATLTAEERDHLRSALVKIIAQLRNEAPGSGSTSGEAEPLSRSSGCASPASARSRIAAHGAASSWQGRQARLGRWPRHLPARARLLARRGLRRRGSWPPVYCSGRLSSRPPPRRLRAGRRPRRAGRRR